MAEVLLVCTGLMVAGAVLVALFMPSRKVGSDQAPVPAGTAAV
jgi:hypothetical protein